MPGNIDANKNALPAERAFYGQLHVQANSVKSPG
jgi:hypothetical protein